MGERMSDAEKTTKYELARLALALMVLGYEPRPGETLEEFVARCERILKTRETERDRVSLAA
ncbi:MAG: hypothetical protein QXI45_02430 [Thermofilaceae archaeon]